MEVCTDVQASAFIKSGWVKVEDTVEKATEPQTIQNRYNKTVINRMSTAELQELALENGVDGANEMTGGQLKKILIDKFCK